MEKGLKINLSLENQSWIARRESGMYLLLVDEWVFDEITSGFSML